MTDFPTDQAWPIHRILVMPPGRWDSQEWTILPSSYREGIGGEVPGYRLRRWQRRTLPAIGQAAFSWSYGIINGREVAPAGDYTGWIVRIQSALAVRPPLPVGWAPAWRTVWMGECKGQSDQGYPASSRALGDAIYACEEILGMLGRWPVDRHGFAWGMPTGLRCSGHPGYNWRSPAGDLAGDRDTSTWTPPGGQTAYCHTWPRKGAVWTDAEVIDDVLKTCRPPGGPRIAVDLALPALGGSDAWEVQVGDSAQSLMQRLLRRERGRGNAFIGWTETDPAGPIELHLRVRPQVRETLTVLLPDATEIDIPGSDAVGTSVSVSLLEDRRVEDSGPPVSAADQWRVDYLESIGDRIEIAGLFGVDPDFTLATRWTPALATAFLTADYDEAISPVYDAVYQLYGLRPDWDGTLGDGDGGSLSAGLVACGDDGQIQTGTAQALGINPALCELLDDLPILRNADGVTPPQRQKILPLLRVAPGKWLDAVAHLGLSVAVRADGLHLSHPDNQTDARRYIGDPSEPDLESIFGADQVAVTACLKLPSCIRYASGNPNGQRRLQIRRDKLGLWLVHQQAIIFLDAGDLIDGHDPVRGSALVDFPAEGVWRIMRDDRAKLARLHALAWTWYGRSRRTANWKLRACGPLTEDYDLGDLVTDLAYQAGVDQVETPITSIDYDATDDATAYQTEWSDLDLDDA
jgi:hypothetical protein